MVYWRKDVRVSCTQPAFGISLLLGAIVTLSATFFLDAQDDMACNLHMWLYCSGFVMTHASVAARLWRIVTILVNPSMRDVKVSVRLRGDRLSASVRSPAPPSLQIMSGLVRVGLALVIVLGLLGGMLAHSPIYFAPVRPPPCLRPGPRRPL